MARLSRSERESLPDSAFAYIDSKGRRRLPINDEAHVRAALARFNQVVFESEEALDKARTKLLRAAKKHGIVPLGFITGQLRSQRQAQPGPDLPTGKITFLMTDIEGSTALLALLGDDFSALLHAVRRIIRRSVANQDGREVDARADEFFAVFVDTDRAAHAAVDIQRKLGGRRWPQNQEVRVRVGIHRGQADLTATGYVGLPVNTVSRVCSAAHGGQILITDSARRNLTTDLVLQDLGRHHLAGLPEPEQLYQVEADGLPSDFPPLGTTQGNATGALPSN